MEKIQELANKYVQSSEFLKIKGNMFCYEDKYDFTKIKKDTGELRWLCNAEKFIKS